MSLSAYASESLEKILKINFDNIDTQIAALRVSYEGMKHDGRDDEKMKEHHGPFFKQLDLLFDSAEEVCRLGFIDLLDVETSKPHIEKCHQLDKAIDDLTALCAVILHNHASFQKKAYGCLIISNQKKITMSQGLFRLAVKHGSQLPCSEKVQRLHCIIDSLYMSLQQSNISDNEHRLRVISQIMHTDSSIDARSFNILSEILIDKINESDSMKYITQNEMYSLVMLLLSNEISQRVAEKVKRALRSKFSQDTLPSRVKQSYYTVFIEMIDIHCTNEQRQQDAITQMLSAVHDDLMSIADVSQMDDDPNGVADLMDGYSQESKYSDDAQSGVTDKSHGSGDVHLTQVMVDYPHEAASNHEAEYTLKNLAAIKKMMEIQLECCVIRLANTAEKIEVFEKQLVRVKALERKSMSPPIRSVLLKMKIVVQANLLSSGLLIDWSRRCDRWLLDFFVDYEAPVQARTVQFTRQIWMNSFSHDDLCAISDSLDTYQSGEKSPTWYVYEDLIESALDNMDAFSVHTRFVAN